MAKHAAMDAAAAVVEGVRKVGAKAEVVATVVGAVSHAVKAVAVSA